jgi:hypothetical protein
MKGAARAIGAFLDNKKGVRRIIRNAISPVIDATDEETFIDAAVKAIGAVSKVDGFGPAIATCLIALARPDHGVSVNRGSAPGLAELTGLPATVGSLASARNYPKLLRWVYAQPWYSVQEPSSSFERTVWSMRAALIDSFTYRPIG